jgi:hypothetical protein
MGYNKRKIESLSTPSEPGLGPEDPEESAPRAPLRDRPPGLPEPLSKACRVMNALTGTQTTGPIAWQSLQPGGG